MIRFAGLGFGAAAAMAVWMASAPAQSQVTKQGGKYLLRMKFTPGQTLRYTYTSEAKSPQDAMKAVGSTTMTVTAVQGKVATVRLMVGQMKLNGKPMGQQPKPMTLRLDDRGRPVGAAAGGQFAAQLPEKPLAVGETFASDTTVGVAGQQFKLKALNKFMGLKKVGGRTVAVVETTTTGTGAIKSSGTGTTTLDVKDGSLVSMVMKQTMTPGDQSQALNSIVTMTRK